MKIYQVNGKSTGMRVRCDLARLASRSTSKYLTRALVTDFLEGRKQLDFEASSLICLADRAVLYIEKFARNRLAIKKTDHIAALLCIFSEDSLGAKVLSDEAYDHIEELQERLNSCKEFNYNGVQSAITVMDYLSFSDFLEGKPYDVWFLLYNLFLHKEGLCLLLEDTDVPDPSLILNMKYVLEAYAAKRIS